MYVCVHMHVCVQLYASLYRRIKLYQYTPIYLSIYLSIYLCCIYYYNARLYLKGQVLYLKCLIQL